MNSWDAARIARESGARLVRRGAGDAGPSGVTIDSRHTAAGELFVGLRGERADGGEHGAEAIAAGAWGVLVTPAHERCLVRAGADAAVFVHPDPLAGLQALARAWRRELAAAGAQVVAITGSTGKTSTKDILAALLSAQRRTISSPANFNTEIGLPLALLGAPAGTEVLVLEMAMRGAGQIAELTAIAEPDVGVITNVGPAHLELLGSLQAIAAAKAELIAGLAPASTIVVPAGEPLLAGHLRGDLATVRFGEGGEVALERRDPDGEVVVRAGEQRIGLRPSFTEAHNLENLLAAVAAARALGVTPDGALEVRFTAMRGERIELDEGVTLINDCYNANPMSMGAAIDELAKAEPGRRVAVLGDMLELGADAARMHREIGALASARGVELLITVGPLAAEMRNTFAAGMHAVTDAEAAAELLATLLRPGDTVLVKGSRGVGLERVADALRAGSAGRRRAAPTSQPPDSEPRAVMRERVGPRPG